MCMCIAFTIVEVMALTECKNHDHHVYPKWYSFSHGLIAQSKYTANGFCLWPNAIKVSVFSSRLPEKCSAILAIFVASELLHMIIIS